MIIRQLFTKHLFFFVFTPLFLGAVIYYYTRPDSIYFIKWVNNLFQIETAYKIQLPYWVVFHLPDGLWAFAFVSVFLIIWEKNINKKNIFWLLMPLISSVIIEISYGTFDYVDLYFILIGGTLPLLYNLVTQFFKYE